MEKIGRVIKVNLREPHSEECDCERCQRERRGERLPLPDIDLLVKGESPIEFDIILPPLLPSLLMEVELDEIFS